MTNRKKSNSKESGVARVGRKRRDFTAEFKREALALMEERLARGVSLAQVGRDLDLHPDQLRAWARQSVDRGARDAASPALSETPEQEVRRLRRELELARQERDFLKKATAYFAKESR